MRKHFFMRKLLSLCLVLAAVAGLTLSGCSKKQPEVSGTSRVSEAPQVLGEGKTVFSFSWVDSDGTVSSYEIHTDETVVGTALLKLGLIEGENGAYGLYVKKVGGVEADYDKNQTYWSFYINGEYASSGVDVTEIDPEAEYSMVYTK